MPSRLPPLNTLRLFEAASRHLSFKLASEELRVTPSAVSHAVQTLEDWFGAALFVRGRDGLRLTKAGQVFSDPVRDALHEIAAATADLRGIPARRPLCISVTPTFASRILIPRLPAFRPLFGDRSISVETSYKQVDIPGDGVDLAVRMGQGEWSGLRATHLLDEYLVPVCSPELASLVRELEPSEWPRIKVTTVSQDWGAWDEANNGEAGRSARELAVDTIDMAIDAAVRGYGVMVGRRPLIDRELASGRLIQLEFAPIKSPVSYWLVGRPETMALGEVQAFATWLMAEIGGEPMAPKVSVRAPRSIG